MTSLFVILFTFHFISLYNRVFLSKMIRNDSMTS